MLKDTVQSVVEIAWRETKDWLERRRSPARKPIYRLRQLVKNHGMTFPQLLHHVPAEWNWQLADIADDQALLRSLNCRTLIALAELFGIRLEWIEGVDDQIYQPVWGYQDVAGLARRLASIDMGDGQMEMAAFVSEKAWRRRAIEDPVLVFAIPASDRDHGFRRFIVCGEQWNWQYWPSRRDVKAIARWFWCAHPRGIPIVPLDDRTRESIRSCYQFPGPLFPDGYGGYSFLDEYVVTASESRVARDDAEARIVAGYLRDLQLVSTCRA